MKRTVFIFLGIVFAFGLMNAFANSDDDRIKESIKQIFLADEKLSNADIKVDVDDGVVTLQGKVLGHGEAQRAIEIVKNVNGVVRVEDKLEVDTTITNEDVEKRLDKSEESIEELKEQAEPNRDLGTVVDDATITAAVKMKFAKDDVVRAIKLM